MVPFSLKKNLTLLFILQILHWFLVVIPVIVLFYQENGLTLAQVFLLQAVFAVAVVVLEIPSGYFADMYGRKNSLFWGSLFAAMGFLLYALSYSFWFFFAGEIFLALGAGLISGADSALMYESLAAEKKESRYVFYEGRYISLGNFSEGVAAVVGGMLAVYWLRLPVVTQAVLSVAALPLTLFLHEPPRTNIKTQTAKERFSLLWNIVKESLWKNLPLRRSIFLASAFGASTLHIVWLIQPYFKITRLPIFWYGGLWALLQFCAGFFSWHAWRLPQYMRREKIFLILIVLIAGAYIFSALFVSRWGIAFFFLAYAARGIHSPLLREQIQDLSSSEHRATILSIKGMLVRLIFSFTAPVGGMLADINLQLSFFVGGIFFALLVFFFWLMAVRAKIF